ncbi:STAS domain-containing protein [bacterium]|jgi:anti-sigma B factor antagonist|nr:STAS domain-containing protein [bacterium]
MTTMEQPPFYLISCSGNLSFSNYKSLRSMTNKGAESAQSIVAFDISDVDYIDSSGLGALIQSAKRLKAKQKSVVIINASEKASDMLRRTHLDRLLPLYSSLADVPTN